MSRRDIGVAPLGRPQRSPCPPAARTVSPGGGSHQLPTDVGLRNVHSPSTNSTSENLSQEHGEFLMKSCLATKVGHTNDMIYNPTHINDILMHKYFLWVILRNFFPYG